MGGFVTRQDAIELMLTGTRAKAADTGNFLNPRSTEEIIDGIKNCLERNNFSDANQIMGLT